MFLYIHPSTKVISEGAFRDQEELEGAELFEGLERISNFAFGGCSYLRRIVVPSTVGEIEKGVFQDCERLEEVELCEGLERIGEGAFFRCKCLKSVKIPSTVRAIEEGAFEDCSNLIEVELDEGLQRIGLLAFYNCKSLRYIKVPSTVKVIGQRAFGCCQKLEVVELSEGLERIEGSAFNKCNTLKQIQIPSTVKVIGEGSFSGCQQLISVELCDGIEQIDESAFQDCDSLRNIAFPATAQTLMSIGRGCYDLQRLFGSHKNIKRALASRFDGLPIHKLCYYQSQNPTSVVIGKLAGITGPESEGSLGLHVVPENNQDSLGMTPLHILACTARPTLDLYQFIITSHPKSLITEDRWGCLPILYAIWGSTASEEVIQHMIESQKATFPSINLNWNKMVQTLCRAGASPNIVQNLLRIKQTAFSEHSIDWQNVAQELTISCLVRCEYDFRDFSLIWDIMMGAIDTSHIHEELVLRLQGIERKFFPDTNGINWCLVCEEFVKPLTGWWHSGDSVTSSITFRFLVKCSVPERLDKIGVTKWQKESRTDIESIVKGISSGGIRAFIGTINSDIVYLPALIETIQSKMIICEQEHHQMRDATFLLELALWKSKIETSMPMMHCNTVEHKRQMKGRTAAKRGMCLVNCGADVIIPIVLQFLVAY